MFSRTVLRGLLQRTSSRTPPFAPRNPRAIIPRCRPSGPLPLQAQRFQSSRQRFPPPPPARQPNRGPDGSYWQRTQFDPEAARRARPLFTGKQVVNPTTAGILVVITGGGAVFYVTHLEEVPVSGRRRFICYSDESVEQEGSRAYQVVMQQYAGGILPEFDSRTRQVRRVMKRLIPASGMDNVEWEVYVVASEEANAFVIPGGKVFVFTGILPVAQDDDGLAAILGHEIAHNLARHTNENMSSMFYIAPLRWVFMMLDAAGQTGGLGRIVGDLFLDLGMMRPSSRKQESEADYIGLMIMAKACYDPHAAANVWQRMEKMHANGVPGWLSTHPTNTSRMEKMVEWLPKADATREENGCTSTSTFARQFEDTLGGWGGFGKMYIREPRTG